MGNFARVLQTESSAQNTKLQNIYAALQEEVIFTSCEEEFDVKTQQQSVASTNWNIALETDGSAVNFKWVTGEQTNVITKCKVAELTQKMQLLR